MEEWTGLIERFASFCIERYGREEVRKWYFEVWNEPNLPFFFKGSQEDYFKLYAATAKALKKTDELLTVGGPATSENAWLLEIQDFCSRNNVPLDFLSTHHYPGDDVGLPVFTPKNLSRMAFTAVKNPTLPVDKVINKMLFRPEILPLIKRDSMRRQLETARKQAGNLPLFYTEWNVLPTCTAPLNDSVQSSAYIIKYIMDAQGLINGNSFWTFSDIYEELTFFTRPFSGVFGLQTIHGIPKPSYHAFSLLNRLGGERFELPLTNGQIEMAAFKKGQTLQFLLYRQNYCDGNEKAEEVRLDLNVPVKSAVCRRIDRENCNPLRYWREMGEPETLLPAQVDEIISATAMREIPLEIKNADGGSIINTSLADNDVVLIEAEI
jgi:xylan 1,4-beta-xylosidase